MGFGLTIKCILVNPMIICY